MTLQTGLTCCCQGDPTNILGMHIGIDRGKKKRIWVLPPCNGEANGKANGT